MNIYNNFYKLFIERINNFNHNEHLFALWEDCWFQKMHILKVDSVYISTFHFQKCFYNNDLRIYINALSLTFYHKNKLLFQEFDFKDFLNCFEIKNGISWEQRIERIMFNLI